MIHFLTVCLKVAATLTIFLCAYVAWGLHSLGYESPIEMDWDESGFVSPAEAVGALDIGMRRKSVDCVEYFSLKTGVPVKTRCDETAKAKRRFSVF